MSKDLFVLFLFGVLVETLANSESTETKPLCGKDEVFSSCGSACPASCDTKGNSCLVCLAICVEGCFCAGNTIRGPDGSCVPPEKCPIRTCSDPNEIFNVCPPTCPTTEKCENLWSVTPCFDLQCCTPECRCKSGFYRDDQNKCISAEECRVNKSNTENQDWENYKLSLHGNTTK